MIRGAGVTLSARGGGKPVNEDAFLLDRRGLYAVADGVSTSGAPAVASRLALRRLVRHCADKPPNADTMRDAIDTIDDEVTDYFARRGGRDGACTLVALHIEKSGPMEGRYIVGSVGDSRGYHIRFSARDVIPSADTPEDKIAGTNMITQYIGGCVHTPHAIPGQLKPGDKYLLVTDGFDAAIEHHGWMPILTAIHSTHLSLSQRVKWMLELACVRREDPPVNPSWIAGQLRYFGLTQPAAPTIYRNANWDDTSIILVERT